MYPPKAGQELRPTVWSSGLFGCFKDFSTCCVTCFCPCITFGQIAEIVDEGSTSCAFGGAVYAVLCYFTGFACCYSCFYRKKMRVQFNLEETCTDCVVHWCCELCALCQEYRELKSRGYDPALGWIGNQQKQEREMGSAMTPPVNPNMAR
ncbi:protein PLANT CADMIUM RESISTANCE 2 [Cryptomeria japonica]|uniref:protein PLANT CADMIUM RESISTANCE 2 n=1 Tax=Cryptomeria japonica TaxID=3369 RepID=UPI0025AB9810|nr:protein PLANT CADMIUM RESISTANCE 2 [Cryptomeria japonica]